MDDESMIKFKEFLELYHATIEEDIKVPIKVGDTVLGGKFKNKKIVVKSIGENEKGDILINNKPMMKYRIIKEK